MNYKHLLNSLQNNIQSAQKTYKGQKRSELKDSDFLFPATRSFPIVSPQDVPDAISNFGRMKGNMSYNTFIKKLYDMCKRKGPEFVAALPKATKDKLGIKSKAEEENETPQQELMEYKQDFLDMNIGSLRMIMQSAKSILESLEDPSVKKNLTASWLQGKIAITEDYMRTIHDFVKYVPPEDDKSVAGCGCGGNKKNPRPEPVDPQQQNIQGRPVKRNTNRPNNTHKPK